VSKQQGPGGLEAVMLKQKVFGNELLDLKQELFFGMELQMALRLIMLIGMRMSQTTNQVMKIIRMLPRQKLEIEGHGTI
jgi:hypothetical protein